MLLDEPKARSRAGVVSPRIWDELARNLRASAPYQALLRDPGQAKDVLRLPVPAAAWVGELLAAGEQP